MANSDQEPTSEHTLIRSGLYGGLIRPLRIAQRKAATLLSACVHGRVERYNECSKGSGCRPTLRQDGAAASENFASQSDLPLRPEYIDTPVPWFLPGAIRIRGGLARHFASAWLFHRGIHVEASLVSGQNKVIQLQRVGCTKLALRVDS